MVAWVGYFSTLQLVAFNNYTALDLMETLEIILVKRRLKFILCVLAAIFCGFGIISFVGFLFKDGFSWWILIVGLLLVSGEILFLSKLYTYLTNKEIMLVVESDGNTINFYNKTTTGKIFHKSETIDLNKMERFYIVKRRTRYLMNNYAFAFEEKGSLTSMFNTEINVFPSLFKADEIDRNKILAFVKFVHPPILLGYETAWEKAKK